MMDQPPITCELVDRRELDRRYVAGQLDDVEAAAFEEHFFGCDRCGDLVKSGAGVRAASGSDAAISPARPGAWWKPLALAAGLAIVAFGTWRAMRPGPAGNPDALRGGRDSIAVSSRLDGNVWLAAWPEAPGAGSYRVRVFTADGRLLLTRESTDTIIGLPADSLTTMGGGGALYLDVQGFDQLRRAVARSPLIPLPSPAR